MKRRLLIVLIVLMMSAIAVSISLAQQSSFEWHDTFSDALGIESSTNINLVTDATRVFGADFSLYSGNPLLALESSDPWDAHGLVTMTIPSAVHPDVLYFPNGMDGYKFWMVYTPYGQAPAGIPPAPNPSMTPDWWWERNTLVRSNDGIHWVKTADYTNPLVAPGPDDWDLYWHADPDFVYAPNKGPSGESWFLYWTGCGVTTCQNGVATSYDGKQYTKIGPIMPGWTRSPGAYYDQTTGIFHMWYNWGSFEVGYATSTDGVNWIPYNPTNPGVWGYIVYRATPGTYDQGGVSHIEVIKYQGVFHMYYNAMPTAAYAGLVIGHATSTDGIHWTQYPTPAVTPANQTWQFTDGTTKTVQSLYRASAVVVSDTMYLYYCGSDSYVAYPGAWNFEIGLAVSAPTGPDGHLELVKDVNLAEYAPTSGTMAWYHMNEGNPPPLQYPGEYTAMDSTLAWYHFNEGTGTTTVDIGGAIVDNGTLAGATWTTGLYGNGLSFNGSGQVTVADSTDLNPQSGLTIEAWVNPSVHKGNNYVINKMTSGGDDYSFGLKLENNYTPGSSEIGGWIRDAAGHFYFAYGGSVPTGVWTHIAMTYQVDPSAPTHVKLYKNGVEVTYRYSTPNNGTDSVPANTLIRTNTGSLNIGFLPYAGSPFYYQGNLEELRILSRALTEQEIAADGSMASVTPTVQDSSGNGNNGLPTSGVSWATGRFSYGLQFNGSSGLVTVPHSASLNTTNSVSIEAWVNPSVDKSNNYVALKMTPGGTDNVYGMKLENTYTGYTEIGGNVADSAGNTYMAYGGRIPTGTWTHVAMTYEVNPTATSHVRLYVNGVEVTYRYHATQNFGTDTIPANTLIRTSSSPLTLGNICYGSGCVPQYFQGVMDELRILNRALAPSEVLVDYGSSYRSSGNLTSVLITPPSGQQWDKFYTTDNRPAGTSVQYSILNTAGQPLITSVVSGTSITSLGSVPIRLHADLTTSDPASTPVLHAWSVTSSSGTIPPPLPSRFYGEIHIEPVPQVGDLVQVQIGGVSRAITTAITSQAGITLTYQIDVPGDVNGSPEKEGGAEGEVITFTVGSRVVATGVWHSGTNTRLDFHSHSVTLQPGWNLVSFNVIPVSRAITDVLSSLAGHYDLAYAWNAPGQTWLKYDDIAMSTDTLSHVDDTLGFWIHITTTAPTLTVYGQVPATTTNITLSGAGSGWNLVGYPSQATRALPVALSDHGVGNFTLVYAYHASDTSDPWKLFDRNATYSNDLTELSPGWGYWIQTTMTNTWTIDYPGP